MKRNNRKGSWFHKKYFLFLIFLGFLILLIQLLFRILPRGVEGLGIQASILFLGMYLLWGKDWRGFLKKSGLSAPLVPGVKRGVLLFIGFLFITIILATAMEKIGMWDDYKVHRVIKRLPWYLMLSAIFIAPLSEELFFRGWMVPKIGVIPSAIVFGAVHFLYGSSAEIIGAIAIGLLLGYEFKKNRNLYSCIFAHFLYNLSSILAVVFLG